MAVTFLKMSLPIKVDMLVFVICFQTLWFTKQAGERKGASELRLEAW